MKVKILYGDSSEKLTTKVNEFVKDKKVFDIKFTTYSEKNDYYNVLIIYEEIKLKKMNNKNYLGGL